MGFISKGNMILTVEVRGDSTLTDEQGTAAINLIRDLHAQTGISLENLLQSLIDMAKAKSDSAYQSSNGEAVPAKQAVESAPKDGATPDLVTSYFSDCILAFGKHKGKNFKQAMEDLNYVKWTLEHLANEQESSRYYMWFIYCSETYHIIQLAKGSENLMVRRSDSAVILPETFRGTKVVENEGVKSLQLCEKVTGATATDKPTTTGADHATAYKPSSKAGDKPKADKSKSHKPSAQKSTAMVAKVETMDAALTLLLACLEQMSADEPTKRS